MAEKPKVFEATSEEDAFNEFEENLINSQMKSMVRFYEKCSDNMLDSILELHQTPWKLFF